MKQRLAAKRKALYDYKRMSKKLLLFFDSRDLDLNSKQSTDFRKMTQLIINKFPGEFNDALKEIECREGENSVNIIRDAWKRDQERNSGKSSGCRWCEITVRVCLLVYARSPAAYKALRDSGVLDLPSERHLQRLLNEQYSSNDESNNLCFPTT